VYQDGSTTLRESWNEEQTGVMVLNILEETKHIQAWGLRACLDTEGTGSLYQDVPALHVFTLYVRTYS
jgi:hypothetical protein